MDVVKFQEMLNGICALAEENHKTLTVAQARDYFAEMELSGEQFAKVLQYLKRKEIKITGAEETGAEAEGGDVGDSEENLRRQIPLTPEEEVYLKEYLEGLSRQEEGVGTGEELFAALVSGDSLAQAELVQRYLPVAARLAAERNCEEIPLADLIQEANISLLTALEDVWKIQIDRPNEEWLTGEICRGIEEAIRQQTERKFADDCLVAKVEKLEAAVRDLSEEDEDGETKFSIEELAIILDMDADEIRDVLRLTGDDK